MAVIGAVLGDIAGSQFEFNRPENLDYKHCELFTSRCSYTDDTIMTLAVKKAIFENEAKGDIEKMSKQGPVCTACHSMFDSKCCACWIWRLSDIFIYLCT